MMIFVKNARLMSMPIIMEGTRPLIKLNNNMEGTPPLRGVPYPTF